MNKRARLDHINPFLSTDMAMKIAGCLWPPELACVRLVCTKLAKLLAAWEEIVVLSERCWTFEQQVELELRLRAELGLSHLPSLKHVKFQSYITHMGSLYVLPATVRRLTVPLAINAGWVQDLPDWNSLRVLTLTIERLALAHLIPMPAHQAQGLSLEAFHFTVVSEDWSASKTDSVNDFVLSVLEGGTWLSLQDFSLNLQCGCFHHCGATCARLLGGLAHMSQERKLGCLTLDLHRCLFPKINARKLHLVSQGMFTPPLTDLEGDLAQVCADTLEMTDSVIVRDEPMLVPAHTEAFVLSYTRSGLNFYGRFSWGKMVFSPLNSNLHTLDLNCTAVSVQETDLICAYCVNIETLALATVCEFAGVVVVSIFLAELRRLRALSLSNRTWRNLLFSQSSCPCVELQRVIPVDKMLATGLHSLKLRGFMLEETDKFKSKLAALSFSGRVEVEPKTVEFGKRLEVQNKCPTNGVRLLEAR